MTKEKSYPFKGGKILAHNIGASWLVSYSYYKYIDDTHTNWKNVKTYSSRESTYNNNKIYHKYWLEEVIKMNTLKLSKNQISINGNKIIEMAKEILDKKILN